MVAIFKYSHLRNRKPWYSLKKVLLLQFELLTVECSVKPVNLQVGRSLKSADDLFIVVFHDFLSFYIFRRESHPSPKTTAQDPLT